MERMERLRKKALSLAEQPGVYLMKNKSGQIIYIGKAKRLKFRVVSYFRQNKAHSQKVKDSNDIARVGTISAGDPEIGRLIAEAMEKVTSDGVITIEENKATAETYSEIVEGM